MSHGRRNSTIGSTLLGFFLLLPGCTPSLIPDTTVPDTAENREICQIMERYRRAMEQRDVDALRLLTSRRYFENASTTADPTDDWGYPELEKVLEELKTAVKMATYDIKITRIHIDGRTAEVDYEYTWNFQYTDGEQDSWTRKTDVNRLSLMKDGAEWKIVAGM
ncbi:MAG: nuclear transport factor 2 family protein [Deltaproteobacteria bacterium]|nr:nuclear transport factor 2 family protein [Deltaproteobacteria bacterium]